MQVQDVVRVFIKGGVLTPLEFLKIIQQAETLGATEIHFGSRQDILFCPKNVESQVLEETFEKINFKYEINTFSHQNIASSYIALDLMPSKKWLASHVYLNIFDSFDYDPAIRINIVDPSQGLVPLFNGELNFIASDLENYWYLYLNFKGHNGVPFQIPALFFTENIAEVARFFEDAYLNLRLKSYEEFKTYFLDNLNITTHPITGELILPENIFPYYEGFNQYQNNQYWLGVYWRNNNYDISKLKDICERCLAKNIGRICLSPWKSFVIKGIHEKDRTGWERLMGKLGLNLRHSSLEMNWHLPALDVEALELKAYLVSILDQRDISTYGLTFTVKTSDDITLFTSVVIEKSNAGKKNNLYNILHSKGFNMNETQYMTFAEDITKEAIVPLLIDLSKVYFDQLKNENYTVDYIENAVLSIQNKRFQCKSCLTIYDQKYGDVTSGIPAGVDFNDLPESYVCPVCEAEKVNFVKVEG